MSLIYVDSNTWTLAYQNALAAADDTQAGTDLNDAILYSQDPANAVDIPEQDFISEKDRIVLELFYLGMQHAREFYEEKLVRAAGDKEKALRLFKKDVDADLVVYDQRPEGIVEITFVDKKLTVRVVYKPTNENIVFVGSDMKTTHMHRFIQRISMTRDTQVNSLDADAKLLESFDFKKPTNRKEWWHKYKAAILKKPTRGHVRLALLSGTIQAALTMGSGTIMWMTGVTDSVIEPKVYLMSGLSFVLGVGLGSAVSTMKNWQLTFGGPVSQTMKRSSISLMSKYLYYGLTYFLITGEGIQGFTKPGSLGTDGVHAHIAGNTFFSNVVRTAWYGLPGLYEDLGKGRENVMIKWRGKEYDQGFTYSQLFFQGIYLIPFILSKVDLVFRENIQLPFDLPFVGSEIEVGRTVLVIGMFVAIAVNKMVFKIVHRRAQKAAKSGEARDLAFLKIVDKILADKKEARAELFEKLFLKKYFRGAIRGMRSCAGIFGS